MTRIEGLAAAAILATFIFPGSAVASSAQSDELRDCHADGVATPSLQTRMNLQDYYPALSIVLGEEGATSVEFVVRSNGTVANTKVIQSSGSLRLDDAAVAAMGQMIYSQPKIGTQPIDCRQHLRIVWKLEGDVPVELRQQNIALLLPPASKYPPAAVAQHREGVTIVEVAIAADDTTNEIRVVRSSGSDDLDAAAVAFVKTRAFKAAQVDGKRTMSAVETVVVWTLSPPQSGAQSPKTH